MQAANPEKTPGVFFFLDGADGVVVKYKHLITGQRRKREGRGSTTVPT
jgi:hypothetical protein